MDVNKIPGGVLRSDAGMDMDLRLYTGHIRVYGNRSWNVRILFWRRSTFSRRTVPGLPDIS